MAGVSLCESGAYFVETSTRVDTVPVATLRNAATGIAVMQLEKSDIGQLLGAWPVRCNVFATPLQWGLSRGRCRLEVP